LVDAGAQRLALPAKPLVLARAVGPEQAMNRYVTGMARSHVLYASATEETGLSDDEFWNLQLPILERAMTTGN
jgi:hypothetical protein